MSARKSECSESADITAAILAGGLGTRLRGAVGERQKVTSDVRGRPFVSYLLDRLNDAGIEVAVLCTGYRADDVAERLGESHRGMKLVHSAESEPLGTGGAVAHALPHLKSPWVLVLNGDSYCGVDLGAFVGTVRAGGDKQHVANGMDPIAGGIVLVHQEDTAAYGRVEIDAADRVRGFVEKGAQPGPGWINAGIYLLKRELIREIPLGRPVSLEREMFPRWISRGLLGYRTKAPFLDIGTLERYAAAREFLARVDDESNRAESG